MKLYLDTCSLHRPFDDWSQPRIIEEAEAIITILAECDAGTISLVSSEALAFEVAANADSERQRFVFEILSRAALVVSLDDAIERRGRFFEGHGIKTLDALHLAFAEVAAVDYFCTCDDRLLKKARSIPGFRLKVVSPLELVREILP